MSEVAVGVVGATPEQPAQVLSLELPVIVLVAGRRLSTIQDSIKDAQQLQGEVREVLLNFFKGKEGITVI